MHAPARADPNAAFVAEILPGHRSSFPVSPITFRRKSTEPAAGDWASPSSPMLPTPRSVVSPKHRPAEHRPPGSRHGETSGQPAGRYLLVHGPFSTLVPCLSRFHGPGTWSGCRCWLCTRRFPSSAPRTDCSWQVLGLIERGKPLSAGQSPRRRPVPSAGATPPGYSMCGLKISWAVQGRSSLSVPPESVQSALPPGGSVSPCSAPMIKARSRASHEQSSSASPP